jgi:hypothetical protein
LLQGVETAFNVRIMWDMFRILQGKKTKLVLCVYDSWLLDVVDTEGEAVMKDIANIFKKYKLNYTIKKGMNYDFGKEY